MAEIAYTAVKTPLADSLLGVVNNYFNEFNLTLVEERIGEREGKYVSSPKSYKDLKEYESSEINPLRNEHALFTTNFDFYTDLDKFPEWSVFVYPTRLAEYTLNIDEDLVKKIATDLNVEAHEVFHYTVVDQVIVRRYINQSQEDLLFIPAEWEVAEAEGYFEKLQNYIGRYNIDSEDPDEVFNEVIDTFEDFFKYVGFNIFTSDISAFNEKTRRPMYLKGDPDDILDFLKRKKATFYIV